MTAWIPNVAVAACVLLTGVSLTLAAVGLVSFKRVRHGRLLWIALAFVALAAEGAYLAWRAYEDRAQLAAGGSLEPLLLPILNLVTVLLLYSAVLKR